MNYEQALEFIHSANRFGKKEGLTRITSLLDRLGNPHKKLRCIHVAGTNGKGSTVSYLAQALQQAGWRTGRYISPYVLDFRERMQLDGAMIPKEELTELVEWIAPVVERMRAEDNAPAEFEIVTAAAFLWFARKAPDVVVLEVGLGGRLDSTNVIEKPLASVITTIDFDHMAQLGCTLEAIALEKCGIIKPGCPAVCTPGQCEEAMEVIRRQTEEKGCALIVPRLSDVTLHEQNITGSNISYRGLDLRVPLGGDHQIINAVTAVECLRLLTDYPVHDGAVSEGIARTRFPARMELFGKRPAVLLDGAHNLSGAQALAAAIRQFLPGRRIGVLGMVAGKDLEGVAKTLAPLFDRVYVVPAGGERTADAALVARMARRHCEEVEICLAAPEGCRRALEGCAAEDTVVVCGSLFLAAEVRGYLTEWAAGCPK